MKATQSTFFGLQITKTSKGFEVKNSTDLVESLLNLYGLEIPKPTANPSRCSTVMELASATPLDGHDYSNFRTAVGKLIFMAPWRPDMQLAIQQLSTQVLNPGMYPAPDIHEHFTIHKWLRQTAYILTHNLNNLEHIANNCMSAMTHTDVTTAHH